VLGWASEMLQTTTDASEQNHTGPLGGPAIMKINDACKYGKM